MVEKLTDEKLKEYKDAFRLFDKNGDGFITTKELGSIMRSLNQHPTEAELQDMIHEADADGDGTIDFEEFLLMASGSMPETFTEKQLSTAFKVFDKDGVGTFAFEDIKHVLINLGENISDQELEEMMREVDLDGDGVVNFKEFSLMMRQ